MEISKDDRNLGMLSHLLTIFLSFLAPLIIWLMKKDQSEFVVEQCKESLNFQISLAIYAFVSGILCAILIGVLGLIVIGIAYILFPIIAAVKVSNGEDYKYPLTIRLLK